ncbi:MAG TPA: regulatory protein RecX [Candidatus Limnocylindrales bacterium]|nr:regulatory protein RecX [Candidatus Limnocylindrales bacterium]
MAATQRRRELPAARRERLSQVDDPQVVLDAALRFLESRQRSVDEVRRRLTTAGYRPELVAGAIERLLGLGVLDDAAFTAAWVESRDRARPRGERALRRELLLKGVDRGQVDDALAARRPEPGADDDPDVAAARRLLERHARTLDRIVDPRDRRQRAYALLARNGFDLDLAAALSREG